MKKNASKSKLELAVTINFILQNLPDPKDNSVSTIKDELLINDTKIMYLAQKSKGSNGFCWNIAIS